MSSDGSDEGGGDAGDCEGARDRDHVDNFYSPMCRKKFVNGVVVKMHYVNFVVKTDDSVPDASEKIQELWRTNIQSHDE